MNNQVLENDLDVVEESEEESIHIDYDIATYPSDFTLAVLTNMWKDKDITIPEFQREFVWTIRQSSLLIDSFLCGLPVPPVFFYIDDENKNLVIDGQQRIMSIVYYFEGYFGKESIQGKKKVFRLTGLSDKSPYHNKKFEDLSDSDKRKLSNSVLRAMNIRQISPSGKNTSAYYIFERLNTGGTPLKPQEIRNVLYRGNFNKLLKKANTDENWRLILGKKYLDKHQKDVELILRVFSLVNNHLKYEKPMKEYLNQSMKIHKNGNSNKVEFFFKTFPEITEIIIAELGEKPFHLRGRLNISALDSVMSILIENAKKTNRQKLKYEYEALKNNEDFIEHTSFNTTDMKTVTARFKLVKKLLI